MLATLAATRTNSLLAHGDSHAAALTGGYRLAFMIGAGLIVAAIALALTVCTRAGRGGAPREEPEPERERAGREPAYSEVS